MKNKHAAAVYLGLAGAALLYHVTLKILEGSVVPSFSTCWLVLAALLVWCAVRVLRRGKDGHYVFMQGFHRWLRTLTLGILCAGVTVSAVSLAFILHPRINDGTVNTKYVIVLGGGIKKDGTLTHMPTARVQAAAEYLTRHSESYAIVTGGKGLFAPIPESQELSRQLRLRGVEDERILEEDEALDTIQNFIYSARIMARKEDAPIQDVLQMPVTVVTSSFHLARAERLARRMGFSTVYGIAAKVPAVYVLNVYCREICSYVKLSLRILLTGKPAPLQDSLPQE